MLGTNNKSSFTNTSAKKSHWPGHYRSRNKKGKQERLCFRNYAKITVLANRFPKVNDQTTAFKERRLFIKFPKEFIGKEQTQNIEENWLTVNDERSGI